MSNMSYCRFENTTQDMQDCLDALAEGLETGATLEDFKKTLSSSQEQRAFEKFLNLCQDVADVVEDLRG